MGNMADSAGIQQGSPAIGAAGLVPAAPGAGGTEGSGTAGGSARIAVKKAQLRSSPRPKKLEKLGVYSSCKVCRLCRYITLQTLRFRGLIFNKRYFLGLVAIVYKMQAKQRKPLPHFIFFHFACTNI